MRHLETEIAVIGAGPAGLAAAISAAERGSQVVVLEKGATTGGTANMGMGLFAVESRIQKEKQIALTKEEAFRLFMDYTHWRTDAKLVKSYIDKSPETISWLEAMGVEFYDVAAYFPGAHFTWHIVKPEGGGRPGPGCAATMTKLMTKRAQALGVTFLLQCPAKKLLGSEEGIEGVLAEDRAGEELYVKAKAVVIATGGFGDNPEWIKRFTGFQWGVDLFSFRIPGLNGDGIRMAWDVGAARSEMNLELIYATPGLDEFPTLREVFRQPFVLMLNLLGERFINEEILPNTTFTGNAVARQKERCAFAVLDDHILERLKKGLEVFSMVFPVKDAASFEDEFKSAVSKGVKDLFMANNLQELASLTGMDVKGLLRTFEAYNAFCERGVDKELGKSPKYLFPLKGPRFFAAKVYPSAYGTLGGIKINHRCEVLNEQWGSIPGLYAAGTDACSIYGDSYMFLLPGNTMGFAVNSGRIAGENASFYVKG